MIIHMLYVRTILIYLILYKRKQRLKSDPKGRLYKKYLHTSEIRYIFAVQC